MSNGLAQIKIMQAALTAAKNAQTSNKDAFDLGVRLNIDVLNAQNQVFSTQSELIRVTVETMLALLKLKAAVGNLAENDVLAINSQLSDGVDRQ
ncbi:TolC family protein [Chitinibacter fontanus]|uniref:TolC family protein n=1 Tax=Chitinibacter fontanus TaxID=1737446 RepID=UPI00223FEFEC|nr:TolC family protein [Chitinibacter fontanus]